MSEEGEGKVSKGTKERKGVVKLGTYTSGFASCKVGEGPHRSRQEEGGNEEGDGTIFRRHN